MWNVCCALEATEVAVVTEVAAAATEVVAAGKFCLPFFFTVLSSKGSLTLLNVSFLVSATTEVVMTVVATEVAAGRSQLNFFSSPFFSFF